MTFVFLCGCLEPGRDGVGDYTRQLAAELIRHKHKVAIAALHDRQLKSGMSLVDEQFDQDQFISVLRLSDSLPWRQRIKLTQSFIEDFDPEWISLQYVPFSFQEKGLPFILVFVVKFLIKHRKLHIMFHELWLGMTIESSRLHTVWGTIQRCIVRLLICRAQPIITHTQLPLYKEQLRQIGMNTSLLPLFSNIPNYNCSDRTKQLSFGSKKIINFVFFGTIFFTPKMDEFIDDAVAYGTENETDIKLTIIGRSGAEQQIWTAAWRSRGLTVHQLGEQTPFEISSILAEASIGLSTTPALLADKSGSIAAMHAHGLPVFCIADSLISHRMSNTAQGILVYQKGNFAQLIHDSRLVEIPVITTVTVVHQFICDLSVH